MIKIAGIPLIADKWPYFFTRAEATLLGICVLVLAALSIYRKREQMKGNLK